MATRTCEPCGITQSVEFPATGNETNLKERFRANFKTISECLNYEELVPLLCEGSDETALLSFEEGQPLLEPSMSKHAKAVQLTQKLEEKSYSKFLDCLRSEEDHLGHAYICDLLEGRQHASEKEMAYSKAVKSVIKKKLTVFTKGINLDDLIPHMMQHKLLTESEMEQFCNSTEPKAKQMFSVLRLLDTKGPLGYSLFAKCLQDEDIHVTHSQLYDLIHKDMDASLLPENPSDKCLYGDVESDCVTIVSRRDPCRITLQGALTGTKYDDMIHTFQTCQYNGAWSEMEAEASKYLRQGVPCELQVTALLEKAMGLIFLKRDEEPFRLITEAKEKCKQVQGNNSTFLEGRCEYVMSVLHRYSKQYDKAKEHAENALRILFIVEQGHDTAFASLIYAALLVVNDGSKTEAKNHLAAAISDAKSVCTGNNVVIPHSYMRLAQILIESTQNGVPDKDSMCTIREAEACLKNVEPSGLSVRSRCRFYLVQSSLYQRKEMGPESKSAAQCCLDLAAKHHYTNEIEAAKDILSKF